MESKTYIYVLKDPRTDQVRYVGKTDYVKRRYRRHIKEHTHSHKSYWVRSLLEQGVYPSLEVIEECDKSVWQEREIYWIAFFKSQNADLVNSHNGGSGALGYSPSEETRKKISQKIKESWLTRDKSFLKELRQIKLEKYKDKPQKRSLETCKKISNALKGKTYLHDKERCSKISASKKGKSRNLTDEMKTKIGAKIRTKQLGERNSMSKLSIEQVREIRYRYKMGETNYTHLGKEYGVHMTTIRSIVQNKSYKE